MKNSRTDFTKSQRKAERRLKVIEQQLKSKTLSDARRLKLRNEGTDIINARAIVERATKKPSYSAKKKEKMTCRACKDEGHPVNHAGSHFPAKGMDPATRVNATKIRLDEEGPFYILESAVREAIEKVLLLCPEAPANGGRTTDAAYADGWIVALGLLNKELGL
jgi:hypothetical protein